MLKIFFIFLESNESVDKFNWIHGWIQMNSLMNSKQFFDELLMNSSEFVDEFKWIHWWIQMNSLMNSEQFVDELLMNPSE